MAGRVRLGAARLDTACGGQLAEAEAGLRERERALAEVRDDLARAADRLGRLAGEWLADRTAVVGGGGG